MVKSKIALLVIAIILYSCQNKVLINELEIVDGKTLYNGKNYSGIAIQKDNQDNIRVEEKYNDGIKFHTKLFYTEGSMQSEWIYDLSLIHISEPTRPY